MEQIKKQRNHGLNKAKKEKNDEFYTQMKDIENYLNTKKEFFKDKIVYLSCDNWKYSKFYEYFKVNFEEFQLKRIITTSYKNNGKGKVSVTERNKSYEVQREVGFLFGDGSFDSDECIRFSKKADIIITNPPFSIIEKYYNFVKNSGKKFIFLAPITFLRRSAIFEDYKNGFFKIGDSKCVKEYVLPDGSLKEVGAVHWWNNLQDGYTPIGLFTQIAKNKKQYEFLDGTDILNIDRISNIEENYEKTMAVPITFLSKWNRSEYDVIKICHEPVVKGSNKFLRILIQKKK